MAKEFLLCAVFALLIATLQADQRSPRVQVYSRYPFENGKENIIHCYVDQFHPPNIKITLEKNGVPIENMKQSDLSFDRTWAFNLLTYAPIVASKNDEITCRVEHSSLEQPKVFTWDTSY